MSASRVVGHLLLGGAILLTVLTLLNVFGMPRYQPVGDPIDVLIDGPLTLKNDNPQDIVRHDFDLPLPPNADYFRIVAIAEGFDIVPGRYGWHRGRIVLLQRDRSGDFLWDLPHVIALMRDNPVKWAYESTILADEQTQGLTVRLELLKATGRMTITRVTVQSMQDAPGFLPTQLFLLIGWALLLATAGVWIVLNLAARRWIVLPLALVTATALFFSVVPAKFAAPVKAVAVTSVDLVSSDKATAKEKTAATADNYFSIAKSGHVLMFIGVGLVFGLARGNASVAGVGLTALFFAALCEMLQLYSPNRSPAGFDLMLNTVSATVGYLLALISVRLLRLKRFALFQ